MEDIISIEEMKKLRVEIRNNVIRDIEAKIKLANSRTEIEELEEDLQIAKNLLFFEKMYSNLD